MSPPTPEGALLPWYRRRGWFVGGAAAVVVAATVLTDLPQHASKAVQASEDTSIVKEINTDVKGCAFALNESLTIHRDLVAHRVKAKDRPLIPGLLRDDQVACSFANSDIFNLSNVEVPGSGASRYLQAMVGTITTWATADAMVAIEAVQKSWAGGSGTAAGASLARAGRNLAHDRALAESELQSAEQLLSARLPPLVLPAVGPQPG
ncbi:MAG TPA: hypothetical protein VFN50_04960 [Acidimicrobiales bacterium]|nr:hypothetical protein [Acidimicrobiales bacterium]